MMGKVAAYTKFHQGIDITSCGVLQASTTTNTQSALIVALRTFFIIIESNLCIFFSITPGVSYNIIYITKLIKLWDKKNTRCFNCCENMNIRKNQTWYSGAEDIPRIRCLVVWGLSVTIESFWPIIWFESVLLPTFGLPTTATYPVIIHTHTNYPYTLDICFYSIWTNISLHIITKIVARMGTLYVSNNMI